MSYVNHKIELLMNNTLWLFFGSCARKIVCPLQVSTDRVDLGIRTDYCLLLVGPSGVVCVQYAHHTCWRRDASIRVLSGQTNTLSPVVWIRHKFALVGGPVLTYQPHTHSHTYGLKIKQRIRLGIPPMRSGLFNWQYIQKHTCTYVEVGKLAVNVNLIAEDPVPITTLSFNTVCLGAGLGSTYLT